MVFLTSPLPASSPFLPAWAPGPPEGAEDVLGRAGPGAAAAQRPASLLGSGGHGCRAAWVVGTRVDGTPVNEALKYKCGVHYFPYWKNS